MVLDVCFLETKNYVRLQDDEISELGRSLKSAYAFFVELLRQKPFLSNLMKRTVLCSFGIDKRF